MTGPLVPTEPLTYGTELNAVYAIARVVAETYDTEAGLDTVFRLSRTIFIFDVVSLFLQDEETGELFHGELERRPRLSCLMDKPLDFTGILIQLIKIVRAEVWSTRRIEIRCERPFQEKHTGTVIVEYRISIDNQDRIVRATGLHKNCVLDRDLLTRTVDH